LRGFYHSPFAWRLIVESLRKGREAESLTFTLMLREEKEGLTKLKELGLPDDQCAAAMEWLKTLIAIHHEHFKNVAKDSGTL
jgi:hypothetical protein